MCLNSVMALAGKLGQKATLPDWGNAIDLQERIIEMLYTDAVKCNVIVTAHAVPQVDEVTGAVKLFPNTLGKKLAPKLGRYFNNTVLVEKYKKGENWNLRFQTQGAHNISLKTSKPSKVPAVLDPADLSTLFTMLKG